MTTAASERPPTGEGLTYERVWAMFQESMEQMRKEMREELKGAVERKKEADQRMQETDQLIKELVESRKETDRQMKETDRQIKEYNKRFGEFTNRFGEMVEYMVAPNLWEKFDEMGLVFNEVTPHKNFSNKAHKLYFEVDVLLENINTAMLVETKTKPAFGDIDDHVKRLEKMRKYADLKGDKRKFFGAIAGVVMDDEVREYAFRTGLYVIVPSGETFDIFIPEGEYSPKEW